MKALVQLQRVEYEPDDVESIFAPRRSLLDLRERPAERRDVVRPARPEREWVPWSVDPASGFEANDPDGNVYQLQLDDRTVQVRRSFRFNDQSVLTEVRRELSTIHPQMDEQSIEQLLERARTVEAGEQIVTESVPVFMSPLQNTSGRLMLASALHERMMGFQHDGGLLGSDALTDRLLRRMYKCAGVTWLRSWILWSMVAMRTRWSAGGVRRASILLWFCGTVVSITAYLYAFGVVLFASPGSQAALDPWLALVVALVAPFLLSVLWGRQWGAGLVASIVFVLLLPGIALLIVPYLVYVALEFVAVRLSGRPVQPPHFERRDSGSAAGG